MPTVLPILKSSFASPNLQQRDNPDNSAPENGHDSRFQQDRCLEVPLSSSLKSISQPWRSIIDASKSGALLGWLSGWLAAAPSSNAETPTYALYRAAIVQVSKEIQVVAKNPAQASVKANAMTPRHHRLKDGSSVFPGVVATRWHDRSEEPGDEVAGDEDGYETQGDQEAAQNDLRHGQDDLGFLLVRRVIPKIGKEDSALGASLQIFAAFAFQQPIFQFMRPSRTVRGRRVFDIPLTHTPFNSRITLPSAPDDRNCKEKPKP
ncbi:hypothetical protein M409DRAFT_59791 [Zasmidium cellare ATCC 36951]|uniref:Uncharacterized protein n=1 Tax=Zasmidium cellare ATCC 36951 TaxID=1080233 RepID=A0A6A6C4U9_ZASCE|nr:uncharacterized protein M409DRAFT_59791 [Zasmidium cellare ATCC 36951]KAF2160769.1 hypothetical protein M409DRAFT_59791 [Zasmidium cellare ATCC 36951]